MKSAKSVAQTGACAFALGVGLAVAAGAAAAVASATPSDTGASKAASSSAGPAGDRSSSATGHRRAISPVRATAVGGQRSTAVVSAPASSIPASLARRTVIRSSQAAQAPVTPTVPVPETQALVTAVGFAARDTEGRMYGNPTLNARYFVAQHSMNCMLMATAAVIGQLTGKTPTEPQIVFEASTTPSIETEGRNMYLGLKSNTGIGTRDALALLRNHGISTTLTNYTNSDAAMDALKAAIDNPDNAVIAAVKGGVIWHATYGTDLPPNANVADHAVVVIGVDTATNTVHINDSGLGDEVNPATGRPWGQDLVVPMDAFIQAWGTSSYLLMSATVAADPQPRAAWVNLAPRRDYVEYMANTPFAMGELRDTDPEAAAHLVHFRT